ncbi:fasciclin domain-containing protein [Niastella sp. OAS944]|uniref:fasciclin domain-containing protein n=1 Tax=Niastella sp. OAS944 TaxID=2664089 RepID=UPI00346BD17F|nr:putative surface protein with fasciclin (FAS1) repeats [Chitinophagaceae bacterium OAS944]
MKHTFLIYIATLISAASFMAGGCKKPDLKMNTTNDVNIVGYLEKYPDSFSLWKEVLDRTETTNFLNAFGAYTAFAPTNSGVKAWLAANSIPSVDAADIIQLKEIVKFHLLNDTVSTSKFKDGKLPTPTMHGQFLITGARNEGGGTSFSINRQALVLQSNIKVGNGYIHVLDHVLEPAKQTIASQLEANPEYSIFVEAMKATGYFHMLDTLETDSSKRWMTLLAESNNALADSNITSFAKLVERYPRPRSNDTVDHLKLYMAYHIINGILFLGDIVNAPSYLTLQPQEVISTKLINNEVVINEDVFNGVLEKGVSLIRSKSDYAATNGVWHTVNSHFAAKVRVPTAVFWDLCMFPEIMKQPAFYKKSWLQFDKASQDDRPIQDIDWHYNNNDRYVKYEYSTTGSLSNYAYNNDILTVPMGGPNRATWMEFRTPPIIKGRYKVWICYRNRSGSGTISSINVLIDGELMQRPVNLTVGYPGGSDTDLESLGWKKYTLGGSFAGRCVGIVDIKTTERHMLRLEPTAGSGAAAHLDMVHFIPIDEVQYLPRFAPDGKEVWQ